MCGREGDRGADDGDDRAVDRQHRHAEPAEGQLLDEGSYEHDHYRVYHERRRMGRLPARRLEALLAGGVKDGLEQLLHDQQCDQEPAGQARRSPPGVGRPQPEGLPADPAGDQEDG